MTVGGRRLRAVGAAADVPDGGRKEVSVDGRAICVFRVDGEYYALRSTCPHQGADLCAGTLGGSMLPSRPHEYTYGLDRHVLRCPWHGWEFDITTGRSLFDPDRMRVQSYSVLVRDDQLFLEW